MERSNQHEKEYFGHTIKIKKENNEKELIKSRDEGLKRNLKKQGNEFESKNIGNWRKLMNKQSSSLCYVLYVMLFIICVELAADGIHNKEFAFDIWDSLKFYAANKNWPVGKS